MNDLKLLMDTFHRVEFTGTWRRLFSRVKKHIIWGVLKSVTGMQASILLVSIICANPFNILDYYLCWPLQYTGITCNMNFNR